MRDVYVKSTLRQPVRTVFIFLLIGFISFAFIARATEYMVVQNETTRLGKFCQSIGKLYPVDVKNKETFYVNAAAEVLAKSGYLDFYDKQQTVSGVLNGMDNTDVFGLSSDVEYRGARYGELNGQMLVTGVHVSDMIVTGTLKTVTLWRADRNDIYDHDGYYYTVLVDSLIAGRDDYMNEQKLLSFFLKFTGDEERDAEIQAFNDSLVKGGRYLFRMYYNRLAGGDPSNYMYFKPLYEGGPWAYALEPDEMPDLSDPVFGDLGYQVKTINENIKTMCVVGTKDMDSIPSFQESSREFVLKSGRFLNNDDNKNRSMVCAVFKDFADARGLAVGDEITLTFRKLDYNYLGYIIDGSDEDWETYETYTETFTIAGIYAYNVRFTYYDSSVTNVIYIPESCLPAALLENDPKVPYTQYSFVLESSQYQDEFSEKYAPIMAEMGYHLIFVENVAQSFWASALPLRQSSAVSAIVFGTVLLLASAFVVFLYVRGRRRDFAILRALGVPKRPAVLKMTVPLIVVGAVGIVVGGALSWNYALDKALVTLQSVKGLIGIEPSSELSLIWLAVFCAVICAVFAAFTIAGAWLVSHKPVLELLQGSGVRAKTKTTIKRLAAEATGTVPAVTLVQHINAEVPASENKGRLAAAQYMSKHIVRSAVKSVLTLAVALCFVLALGWMSKIIESNEIEVDRLFNETNVTIDIVPFEPGNNYTSFIGSRAIYNIQQAGYLKSVYLEMEDYVSGAAKVLAEAKESEVFYDEEGALDWVTLAATNDAERYFSVNDRDYVIEYAEGWDSGMFAEDWSQGRLEALNRETRVTRAEIDAAKDVFQRRKGNLWGVYNLSLPVVVHKGFMDYMDLNPGDTFYLFCSRYNAAYITTCIVVGSYVYGAEEGGLHEFDQSAPLFLPMSAYETMNLVTQAGTWYSYVELTVDPSMNRELQWLRDEITRLINSPTAGRVRLKAVLWDEELRRTVEPLDKNLRYMRVLYPVTIGISILIAAGLAALLMFQNAREAALMRVLGQGKKRVRGALCVEHAVLCVVGLVVGLGALAIVRQDISDVFTFQPMLCAGLYLAGSIIGAIVAVIPITNRTPLELLQVKE